MGQIVGGIYTPGKVDVSKLRNNRTTVWKQGDHKRQRNDFASEVVQPYNRDGTPNPAFIDNYPEESVDYGFVKSEAELIGLDSNTPTIGTKGAEIFNGDDEKLEAIIPEEIYGED